MAKTKAMVIASRAKNKHYTSSDSESDDNSVVQKTNHSINTMKSQQSSKNQKKQVNGLSSSKQLENIRKNDSEDSEDDSSSDNESEEERRKLKLEFMSPKMIETSVALKREPPSSEETNEDEQTVNKTINKINQSIQNIKKSVSSSDTDGKKNSALKSTQKRDSLSNMFSEEEHEVKSPLSSIKSVANKEKKNAKRQSSSSDSSDEEDEVKTQKSFSSHNFKTTPTKKITRDSDSSDDGNTVKAQTSQSNKSLENHSQTKKIKKTKRTKKSSSSHDSDEESEVKTQKSPSKKLENISHKSVRKNKHKKNESSSGNSSSEDNENNNSYNNSKGSEKSLNKSSSDSEPESKPKINILQDITIRSKTVEDAVIEEYGPVKKIKTDDFNISDSEELYLLQTPRNIFSDMLIDGVINLNGGKKIKINNEKYMAKLTPVSDSKLLIANHAESLKLQGTIRLQKYVKSKKEIDIVIPDKKPVPLPSNLKNRHPIFGFDYTEKINLDEIIEQKLQEARINIQKVSNKSRKKKDKSKVCETVESESSQALMELLSSHKTDIKKESETETTITEETLKRAKKNKKSKTKNEFISDLLSEEKSNFEDIEIKPIKKKKDKSLLINSTLINDNFKPSSFNLELSSISNSTPLADKKAKKSKKKNKHDEEVSKSLMCDILSSVKSEVLTNAKRKSDSESSDVSKSKKSKKYKSS